MAAGDKMFSKTTIWIEDDYGMWKGVCKECKGEKAKYTPQALKQAGIKPCETCTDLEKYNAAKVE